MEPRTRRSYSRSRYEAPILFSVGEKREFHPARMFNSSVDGMYFETDHVLSPEEDVFIRMVNYSPESYGPEAYDGYLATVKWCRAVEDEKQETFGIGVQYTAYGLSYLCDLCGKKMSFGQARQTQPSVYLCGPCHDHIEALPRGIKKNIQGLLMGNVV